LQTVYRLLYGDPLEDLGDLAALETLVDLVGLEAPMDKEGQDNQEDLLLLQLPQLLLHQLPTMMTDLWAVYPKPTREIENLPEHFSTNWFTTSKQTHESQD
jgi:hypothetical protein